MDQVSTLTDEATPRSRRIRALAAQLGRAVGADCELPRSPSGPSSLELLDKRWYHNDDEWLVDTALEIDGLGEECRRWNREWKRLLASFRAGASRELIYRSQFRLEHQLPKLAMASSSLTFCMGRWNYTARLRRSKLIHAGQRKNWSLPVPQRDPLPVEEAAVVLSFGGACSRAATDDAERSLASLSSCCNLYGALQRKLVSAASDEAALLQYVWRQFYGLYWLSTRIGPDAVRLSLEAELNTLFRYPDLRA